MMLNDNNHIHTWNCANFNTLRYWWIFLNNNDNDNNDDDDDNKNDTNTLN